MLDINPFERQPISIPAFAALDQPIVARIEEVPATPTQSSADAPDMPGPGSENSSQDNALFEVHRAEDEQDTLLRDPTDLLRALDISNASEIVNAVEMLADRFQEAVDEDSSNSSLSDDESMSTYDS